MTANTNMDGNQEKGKEPKRKRQPLYLNWQLWIVGAVSFVLITLGLFIALGPVAIAASIVAMAGLVSLTAGPIIEAWSKINDKIKDVRERAERAEEKALIEGKRNTEIEKKADKAASTAVVLAGRVDVNTERTDLLDKRYEIISDMAYQLTNDLQEERAESKLVLAELKAQNHEQQQQINRLKEDHRREITELKEQIRLMVAEKSSDKEKIVFLQSQIKQLQDRVKELEDREGKLTAENEQLKQVNYELRTDQRRRATDSLTGLSAEADAKLNRLENGK